MAGIYVHIPYCHKACHYCNFHFSTSLKDLPEMVPAICKELQLRAGYLNDEVVETIYFGGGTPSILTGGQLSTILKTIFALFSVSHLAEITLEANPEDIHEEILAEWKSEGINRLSIGIQTFQDERLKWMNRNHTVVQSMRAVSLAQAAGFENITVDLIYGLPHMTDDEWRKEIHQVMALNIPHVSSYCLTIEEKTVFGHQLNKGLLEQIPEDLTERHLIVLMEEMVAHGYEQYEISNFCKPGFESIHNSNYWKRKKYLGIGPGAHSYNLQSRHYSVSNNAQYLAQLRQDLIPLTTEELSAVDHYHEYLLTRLRTKWGVNLSEVENWIPTQIGQIELKLDKLCQEGFLKKTDTIYFLTQTGKMLADEITLKLMI